MLTWAGSNGGIMAVVSSKLTGVRKNGRNGDQISNSVRGADSSELTSVKVNNEVAFCRVTTLQQKEEVEKRLLQHRISYFVKWQEQSVLKRVFGSEKEKLIFVICIHNTAIEEAKELVADMQDVKLLV